MAGDLDVASVPGSGSSFVLVLPGPVGAEPTAVASATSRAVAEEEVGLEERAVLRAIASPPAERRQGDRRQAETTRPTLLRRAMETNADRQPSPAKGHLRAIEGSGGRGQRNPG
jgi:hypothetical protein